MFAGGRGHNNYSYAIVLRRPVAAAMDRYLLPGRARSSKPARKLPQRADRTDDGQTDTVPLHKSCRVLCKQRQKRDPITTLLVLKQRSQNESFSVRYTEC